jgi:hypothetical protein
MSVVKVRDANGQLRNLVAEDYKPMRAFRASALIPRIGPGQVVVGESRIKDAGMGLFADRDFARYEVVTFYDGPVFVAPLKEAEIPVRYVSHTISLGKAYIIFGNHPDAELGVEGTGGGALLNELRGRGKHNVRFWKQTRKTPDELAGDSIMLITATRDIKKDEELYVEYNEGYWARMERAEERGEDDKRDDVLEAKLGLPIKVGIVGLNPNYPDDAGPPVPLPVQRAPSLLPAPPPPQPPARRRIVPTLITPVAPAPLIITIPPQAPGAVPPPLTQEEEPLVTRVLTGGGPDEVVAEGLTRAHWQRLLPDGWLSDEVINLYFTLLGAQFGRCHFFGSYFFALLEDSGYARVRNWTKKVDLFAKDLVLVPVHLGDHWALAILNMRDRAIEYYDSLGGRNPEAIDLLRDYLQEEHKDKKGADIQGLDGWMILTPGTAVPQQTNGSDCGVFVCRFAYCRAAGLPFGFSAADMPLIRRSMMVELLSQRLRIPGLATPTRPRRNSRPTVVTNDVPQRPPRHARNDDYCCVVCGKADATVGYAGTSAVFCGTACVDRLLAM